MALKFFSKDSAALPQEKRQRFLMVVLIVVILAILITLYFYFSHPSQTPMIESEVIGQEASTEDVVKKINFDIDFLKSPHFLALKMYGEWPLQIKEKGRTNPFLPY